MTRVVGGEKVLLGYTGSLSMLDNTCYTLVHKNVLLVLKYDKQFNYELKVVDPQCITLAEERVDKHFRFNIDYIENSIKFVEEKKNRLWQMTFHKEVVNDVKSRLLQAQFESQYKQRLEEVVEQMGEDPLYIQQQLDQDYRMQVINQNKHSQLDIDFEFGDS